MKFIKSQIPGFLIASGLILGGLAVFWLDPRFEALTFAAQNYKAMKGMTVSVEYVVKK